MSGPMPKPVSEWDAQAYHRLSGPQFSWGLQVLSRLKLDGHETVLDAGCGSGRLTAELLERLPEGRVIAVDTSRNMVEEARARLLPRYGGRVELLQADLLELTLSEVADVVFSTATFHWVLDHDRLFANLFRALRPGGRLCAQCGGGKNLQRLRQRAFVLMAATDFAPSFADWSESWYYPDPDSTFERLSRAGFGDLKVWLEEAPTPFPDEKTFSEFLRAVVLRTHMAKLPDEALRARYLEAIVREAAHDDPPYTLDYWRLNIEARKPA
jgi:trans-aconitate 2-methyltransferase